VGGEGLLGSEYKIWVINSTKLKIEFRNILQSNCDEMRILDLLEY